MRGTRYEQMFGTAYSASDINHPFNQRTVELINAWGNYHKYLVMVRPDRTYNFEVEIDHPDNLGSFVPSDRFQAPVGNLIASTLLEALSFLTR